MPFIIDDIFSATVLINIESCLLGIILALLTLFDALMAIETAPIRASPSFIMIKHPFWKRMEQRKKSLPVPGLTILLTRTSGSFSIWLSYSNRDWLDNFKILLLPCPCPQLCLVLQIP